MQINKRSFVILRQIAGARVLNVSSCKIMDAINSFVPGRRGGTGKTNKEIRTWLKIQLNFSSATHRI
jgi:hypothetical protein